MSLHFSSFLPATRTRHRGLDAPRYERRRPCQVLRKDEVTSSLPLMMLTARNDGADMLKSFDADSDDYVSEPFSPKELIARIRALMRSSGVLWEVIEESVFD